MTTRAQKEAEGPQARLSTGALAEAEGVSRSTVSRWAKAGCPHEEDEGGRTFDLAGVRAWRAARGEPARSGPRQARQPRPPRQARQRKPAPGPNRPQEPAAPPQEPATLPELQTAAEGALSQAPAATPAQRPVPRERPASLSVVRLPDRDPGGRLPAPEAVVSVVSGPQVRAMAEAGGVYRLLEGHGPGRYRVTWNASDARVLHSETVPDLEAVRREVLVQGAEPDPDGRAAERWARAGAMAAVRALQPPPQAAGAVHARALAFLRAHPHLRRLPPVAQWEALGRALGLEAGR